MVAIIDYGVGNLFSLKSSFAAIGAEAVVSADPDVLRSADRLILPGVGAFGDAEAKLRESGLDKVLLEEVAKGKPLMGICLGMQMLFDVSFEYGEHKGLGLISGEIKPIADVIPEGLPIPQIGWNALCFKGEKHPIFKLINFKTYKKQPSRCHRSKNQPNQWNSFLFLFIKKLSLMVEFFCLLHTELLFNC